jgi:hypothetical protein
MKRNYREISSQTDVSMPSQKIYLAIKSPKIMHSENTMRKVFASGLRVIACGQALLFHVALRLLCDSFPHGGCSQLLSPKIFAPPSGQIGRLSFLCLLDLRHN